MEFVKYKGGITQSKRKPDSSYSFREHAQSAISFQVSIPQKIAVTAIMIISRTLCLWLYVPFLP